MKLIDIGINVNSQLKDDLIEVLHNAKKHHVEEILLTTVDEQSFVNNIAYCGIESPVPLYTTWGLHPHHAKHLDSFLKKTKTLMDSKPECVKAIGEFGLDFFRMISSKEEQEKAMHFFMNYAKEANLPVFLHERQAFASFHAILKEHNLSNKGVVHCFTGNKHEARAYLDLGMYLGITGWICDDRRNGELLEAMHYIPLNKMMIETDSPYLKPRTVKSKSIRNEPAYLIHVLKKVAEIKKTSIEEASKILYNNTVEFFNIK
jgi:TatD DNase family protein